MDTKVLKDKILQLAIQGKLAPQDENDEPASVLLERIKEEKEKLIKDKIIKKEKSLPEITDDEKTFKLPKGWEWCRLGEIIALSDNLNIQSKLNPYEIINYLDIDSIDNTQQKIKGTKLEPVKKLSSRARRVLKKNMIVYSMVRPYLKNMAIITEDKENFIGSTGFVAFKSIIVEKEYIFNYLRSEYVTNKLNAYTIGFNSPSINLTQFTELEIPLPPLEEQKRIVEKLGSLFKLIDEFDSNKQDLLQNISDTRNKVLQLAIQGKLVPQNKNDEPASVLLERIKEEKEQLIKDRIIKKEKPLQEISDEEKFFKKLPKGWSWCRLGDIGFTNIGLTYKPTEVSAKGTIVLRSTNIQNGKIDLTDLVHVDLDVPKNKMCEVGDILICARNGSKRLVGKSAIITEEGMSFGAFMAIYRSICNEYINLFINSHMFRIQLVDANTVTINQITQSMLKNIICPIPPLEEQKRIIVKVNAIMNYLNILEKEIK